MLDLVRGRHLVYDTPLDRDEVTRRLEREIVPPVWQWYERRPQLFEGRFDGERFNMVRLVRGRNSFRPVIEGRLLPGRLGTRVDVTLRAHPVVLILCGVFTLIGGVLVALLLKEWRQSEAFPLAALPLFGLFALAVFGPFVLSAEARRARRMLETLFGVTARRPHEPPGVSSA